MPAERAAREAAHWYARLGAPDCTAEDRAAFERWRLEPAHAAAFAEAERVAEAVRRLAMTDAKVRGWAAAALADTSRMQATEPSTRRRWVAAALAASIAAAAGFWALPQRSPAPAAPLVYATAADEQRRIDLEDGTVVHLDVGSRIEILIGAAERRIALPAGRAIFDVAHDARRPFTVRAGRAVVTALGTRFQVEQADERVVVTLTEGSVSVSSDRHGRPQSQRLAPGEQLSLPAELSAPWSKRTVDLRAATSWSQGRHVFRSVPLAEAVREINRYAQKKVRLGDPALADLLVNGNFVAGDSDSIVAAIAEVLPVTRADAAGEIVLLRRDTADFR